MNTLNKYLIVKKCVPLLKRNINKITELRNENRIFLSKMYCFLANLGEC